MLQHITLENFDAVVLKSSVPVLVDFYADWCGPCKMMTPVLEAAHEELGDSALICKVNVDECMPLAQTYQIMNIPAMFVFKDGVVVEKIIGAVPKAHILETIKKHI